MSFTIHCLAKVSARAALGSRPLQVPTCSSSLSQSPFGNGRIWKYSSNGLDNIGDWRRTVSTQQKKSMAYIVQDQMMSVAPHHDGIEALWKLKWRRQCSIGVYPFGDGKVEDFDKVFEVLIKKNLKEPYNVDEYASAFVPVAEDLERQGDALLSNDPSAAAKLYLRAACVYRISRYPIVFTDVGRNVWEQNKRVYMKAAPYLDPPNFDVEIPHKHAANNDKKGPLRFYLRTPGNASPSAPVPVLIFVCGLDAYRTDHTTRIDEHVRRGFAAICIDMPGTGDSPADAHDPFGSDRQWSTLLDWIDAQPHLDSTKVCARSVSTGGYYGMRIAHTHGGRLRASVAQGGGSHYMFDPTWIDAQAHMEYPFALAPALARTFGYGDDLVAYRANAQTRFSLLENGIFDKSLEGCKLLLINGMKDSIFPIEDSMLPLRHGDVKDARFLDDRYHVGNPGAEEIIYDWLDQFK